MSATQWRGTQREGRVSKPLTTQFVKRQPRLTKPLELKKRPHPKRRSMQRTMVSAKAKVGRQQASSSLESFEVAQILTRPEVHVSRAAGFRTVVFEAETVAQQVAGAREDKHAVDMCLEMVDIEALDTGKFHAMIIEDPTDKRNVSGYFHIAAIFSESIFAGRRSGHNLGDFARFIQNVAWAMNTYTGITTDVRGMHPFGSSELLKTPWIFITSSAHFQLNRSEAANLGRYFTGGGFAFIETAWARRGDDEDMSLRQMVRDALATRCILYERDWTFEKLPNDHPLYHCYFDFDGPPAGTDGWMRSYEGPNLPYPFVEGVVVDGRLILVYSNKNIEEIIDWAQGVDSSRQFQFVVNMVIFALTQEGSITNQVMDSVRY